MHSYGMAQNILKAAVSEAEKHEAKRIEAICIKLGEMDFAEADSLEFCLEAMARGTVAEGAKIQIELAEVTKIGTQKDPLSISLKLA